MADLGRSIARVQQSMDLDRRLIDAMMAISAQRADAALLATLQELEDEYQLLLLDTPEDEQLLTAAALREKLADLMDWRARALESVGRSHDAICAFEAAGSRFEAAGKTMSAKQARDKAAQLRMELGGDFDEEIQRLRSELDTLAPGSLERAEVLVQLGELHSKANDDFEAAQLLEEALKDFADLSGSPRDEALLQDMITTLRAIEEGQAVAGHSPIEHGVRRRALGQRLLLALANAYRVTNPGRAAEIEKSLRSMAGGKEDYLAGMIGSYLDRQGDISRSLAELSRKPT